MPRKKKPPAVREASARPRVVHARLTEAEGAAFDAAVEQSGLTASALLRVAVLATSRRLDLPAEGAGVELAADLLRALTPTTRLSADRERRRLHLVELARLLLSGREFGQAAGDPLLMALERAAKKGGGA